MDYNISMTLSGHNQSRNSSSTSYVLNGKILLCTMILLFVVIAVLAAIHAYVKWYLNRRRNNRIRRRLLLFTPPASSVSNNNGNQALDVCVLKTIPTFVYCSDKHEVKFQECAVCLSEFEENETGRLLPKCGHAFHVDCIDMWFQSHSNCPLCRAAVQAAEGTGSTEADGSGSGGGEVEVGCSSRPHVELVSVVIEVPPRGNPRNLDELGMGLGLGLGNGSPESNGFKSSGNRSLSLKRLWSV